MSDSPAPATPKKAAKTKKPAAKKTSTHPPVKSMVRAAIKALKERNGSSLQAIKKYIAANYKVDPVKINRFLKKYLVKGVENGDLTQVKGHGANGSFKIKKAEKEGEDKPKKAPKKKAAAKKPKTDKPKKAKTPKKAAAKKPKAKTPKKKAVAKPKKAKSPAKKPAAKKVKKPAAKKAKK